MKSSYMVRARQFAQEIYPYISDCKSVEDFEWAVEVFNRFNHRAVKVANGLTRVALITSDYVLKIDYGTRQKDFGGCADEYRAYQRVFKDGYADLFARISAVMVNEKVYYIMPKIDRIGEEYNGDIEALDVVDADANDYLWEHFRDLHCNNFGWKNGNPVIVDYAYFIGDND